MSFPARTLVLIAAAASVTGCAGLGRAMGVEKVTPDEFRVVTRAPLTVPPDYALRPPRPGEPRPQELAPDQEARAALFGQDVGQEATSGERVFVTRAGADAVDPNIRQTVDFEGGNIVRRSEAQADPVLQPDARTPEQRAADEEAARRATGGGAVTIERGESRVKLPGT